MMAMGMTKYVGIFLGQNPLQILPGIGLSCCCLGGLSIVLRWPLVFCCILVVYL